MKKVHFIDCGANVGNAIDWAVEKYKERLTRVDAFEPEYINYSHMLAKYSANEPINNLITIHTQAIWIKNIIKTFDIQFWGTRTGSSLMRDKEQIIKEGQTMPSSYTDVDLGYTNSANGHIFNKENLIAMQDVNITSAPVIKQAQCIDLSDWVFKNVSKENYNILKIDIEGAEYPVINHLLDTGAYEYIDEWLVEFTSESRVPESFDQGVIDRFKSIVPDYTDWAPFGDTIMGDKL